MKLLILVFLPMAAATMTAQARVKLVALPDRARVVVSLRHPSATLVEEERVMTLQNGLNQIDFAWKDVQIDPASILVRPLDHPETVLILNTSFPPNENALVWEISSDQAREERFRISYLLSNFHRDIVYKAVAAPDEKSLTLRNYLRLRNQSGEDLSEAEVSIGYGPTFKKSIQHEEILEMLSERMESVPVSKILTWDAARQPWEPEQESQTIGIPISYVLTNGAPSKLGLHPLLPGKVRIFIQTKDPPAPQDDAPSEGVAFTGEDWAALTPLDRELKLAIGQSREVKVTQRKTKDDRENIRRNDANQIVLYDTDEIYKLDIENFKKEPADLVVVEHIPGYWRMTENSHAGAYRRIDAFTFEYHLTLPPESNQDNKTVLTFRIQRLNVQGNEPSAY